MRRDARVALCVDVERALYSYVEVRGTARIENDQDELRRMATRIGERYMGRDRAEEYGTRNAPEGELLVRVRPDRVVARDAIAD